LLFHPELKNVWLKPVVSDNIQTKLEAIHADASYKTESLVPDELPQALAVVNFLAEIGF
jgi:hypothetical protein